jgi:hypothetical protein
MRSLLRGESLPYYEIQRKSLFLQVGNHFTGFSSKAAHQNPPLKGFSTDSAFFLTFASIRIG